MIGTGSVSGYVGCSHGLAGSRNVAYRKREGARGEEERGRKEQGSQIFVRNYPTKHSNCLTADSWTESFAV